MSNLPSYRSKVETYFSSAVRVRQSMILDVSSYSYCCHCKSSVEEPATNSIAYNHTAMRVSVAAAAAADNTALVDHYTTIFKDATVGGKTHMSLHRSTIQVPLRAHWLR